MEEEQSEARCRSILRKDSLQVGPREMATGTCEKWMLHSAYHGVVTLMHYVYEPRMRIHSYYSMISFINKLIRSHFPFQPGLTRHANTTAAHTPDAAPSSDIDEARSGALSCTGKCGAFLLVGLFRDSPGPGVDRVAVNILILVVGKL